MRGKAGHSLRAFASRAMLGGLLGIVGTVAWTTPAIAATAIGGLLDGAGTAVAHQAKPVGEATTTVVSQSAPSSAVTPPSTPPGPVPVDVSSPASATASPPSSSALPPTTSIARAPALSRSTTSSAAYKVPSAVPRPLSDMKRTITSGTIIRRVTSRAGLLVSRVATSAASSSSSASSLPSIVHLSAEGLPSLAVLEPLAAAVGSAPIAPLSGFRPTGGGLGFASGILSTPNLPGKGPIGSNGTPVSAWATVTAMPGGAGGWGLPPPRASPSTTLIEPTAVVAAGVLARSTAARAAAPSASARAPIGAHPAAPGSGFSSAAGSSSGFASLFLMLAGLLALGAPWARRLLRPFGRSRRPAPFVLIPERPG
jgi:hypothetical protein